MMWFAQNSTEGRTLPRETGIFLKLSSLPSIRTPMNRSLFSEPSLKIESSATELRL
jgi:hypothetical protein